MQQTAAVACNVCCLTTPFSHLRINHQLHSNANSAPLSATDSTDTCATQHRAAPDVCQAQPGHHILNTGTDDCWRQ